MTEAMLFPESHNVRSACQTLVKEICNIRAVGILAQRLCVELIERSMTLNRNLIVDPAPFAILMCNDPVCEVAEDCLCIFNGDLTVAVCSVSSIVRERQILFSEVALILQICLIRICEEYACGLVCNERCGVVNQRVLCVFCADAAVEVGIAAVDEVDDEVADLHAFLNAVCLDGLLIVACIQNCLLNCFCISELVSNRSCSDADAVRLLALCRIGRACLECAAHINGLAGVNAFLIDAERNAQLGKIERSGLLRPVNQTFITEALDVERNKVDISGGGSGTALLIISCSGSGTALLIISCSGSGTALLLM